MIPKEDYEKIKIWAKAYESLEKIINEQHSPLIKTDIGYNHMTSHTQCDDKFQYNVVQRKTESSHTLKEIILDQGQDQSLGTKDSFMDIVSLVTRFGIRPLIAGQVCRKELGDGSSNT